MGMEVHQKGWMWSETLLQPSCVFDPFPCREELGDGHGGAPEGLDARGMVSEVGDGFTAALTSTVDHSG